MASTSVWVFAVVLPFLYLCILPAFTQLVLDDKPFAYYDPLDRSISAYLQTPPANGGFALFMTPSVVYVATNPLTRRSRLATFGQTFFVAGYILIVLFPLGYASYGQHAVGFVLGSVGLAIVCLGLVLNIRFSPILLLLYLIFLVITITSNAVFFVVPTSVFVVFEYANALFALGFAPLVNTIGRPGRWIWFEGRWLRYQLNG